MAMRMRKLTGDERQRLRAEIAEAQRELRELIDHVRSRLGEKR
jgi:hypothetical protein